MEQSLWSHLPLLLRSSLDSVEYILQTLWRTRKTGLDPPDWDMIRDMLQLQDESDLDPLLVCLRILIRRCVYENVTTDDDVARMFPDEVSLELRRLLTLLLLKFQREWREDALKDQGGLPRLKTMTWDVANAEGEFADPVAVINLKLGNDSQTRVKETEVRFELGNGTLETMLDTMNCIGDQFYNVGEASNAHLSQDANA